VDDALKERSENLLRPKRNCTFALPRPTTSTTWPPTWETPVKVKFQTITEETPLWLKEW